jgi:hypothetical protein
MQEEALFGEHAAEEAMGLLYDRILDDELCNSVMSPKQDLCKQCSIWLLKQVMFVCG